MKIRSGFVSNSSTTSFLIYGTYLDTDSLDWGECRKLGLEYHCDPWDDGAWVGMSWSEVKDDETGAQFKTRVETQLSQLGIDPEQCGTYEEAWRDG